MLDGPKTELLKIKAHKGPDRSGIRRVSDKTTACALWDSAIRVGPYNRNMVRVSCRPPVLYTLL